MPSSPIDFEGRGRLVALNTSESDPGSHRPISLLTTVSRLLERVVAQRLNSFFFIGITFCLQKRISFRKHHSTVSQLARIADFITHDFNPYPTAFPYGNGMVLHFYQQQESSTTKTVYKVINKGLKTYV